MQTFLPFASFAESARVLDNSRLGNQCYRECLTLYNGGWSRHPAYAMWFHHKPALALYALACAEEMAQRSTWRPEVIDRWTRFWSARADVNMPPWLGDEDLHASHRAALLYKDIDWYGQFGWFDAPAVPDEKGRLPYVWPVVYSDH